MSPICPSPGTFVLWVVKIFTSLEQIYNKCDTVFNWLNTAAIITLVLKIDVATSQN